MPHTRVLTAPQPTCRGTGTRQRSSGLNPSGLWHSQTTTWLAGLVIVSLLVPLASSCCLHIPSNECATSVLTAPPTPLQPSNTGTRQGQKRRGRSSIPSACGAARPPPRRLAGLLLASYFPYYKDIKALDTTRLPPGQAIVLLSAPTSSHYKDLARAGVRHGYHLSRKAIVSSRLDHGLLCGKGRPNHP